MLWNDRHSERYTGNANTDSHTGAQARQCYSNTNARWESTNRLQSRRQTGLLALQPGHAPDGRVVFE